MGVGEFEQAILCKRARLVHAVDEEQGLAQLGEHEGMAEHAVPGDNAIEHLVQERQGLGSTPGKSIGHTQEAGDDGEDEYIGELGER